MSASGTLAFTDSFKESGYKTYFVELILPLPLPKLYTYRVPNDWNDFVFVGGRVIVQFGKKKIYTAVIVKVTNEPPVGYESKMILDILDDEPLISQMQLDFMEWMSSYYIAHPGDVLNAALPSGLKLSSESNIQIHPKYEYEKDLAPQEELLLNLLQKKESLSYTEAQSAIQVKNINKIISKLIKREAILVFEQVKDKFKPKVIKRIRLKETFNSTQAIEDLVNGLEKKQKQQEVLMTYLSISNIMAVPQTNFLGVPKSELKAKNVSDSSVKTLLKEGILEEFEQEVSRFNMDRNTQDKKDLNPYQQTCIQEIRRVFETKNTCLLHGITGSGKTEIFIHLIEEQLTLGKQVLYLLPEIALSTQIFSRLRKIFGTALGVYHSRFSDNERVEVYRGLKSGDFQVILGVRSSIFLPFDNLGLVIVDEEHDQSYKQFEPSPRYQARDSALMLAHLHKAKVLLGTATPSFESYYLAQEGKYGLVELLQRHGQAVLPSILLAPSPFVRDGVNYFSDTFSKLMTTALNAKQQAIVFQNRRGYAPYMLCRQCEHIPMCINCNVSMTYHRFSDELRCHYCGNSQSVPSNCEECGSPKIELAGMGTEKLEEDLKITFKTAIIDRLDADTAKSKNRLERIINDFKSYQTDVLIGTQMVTKGLDFDNVTLVAVFDIDRMLFFPDFRSSERVVQLLTQISGRAGRAKKQGTVLIQTNNPKHELIQSVTKADYKQFYQKEIGHRRQFMYPPYCRLIKIVLKHTDKLTVERASLYMGRILKEKFGTKAVIGPEEPVVNRIRNQFIEQIYFKLPKNQKIVQEVKLYLVEIADHVNQKPDFKSVRIILDVDPF